MRGLRFSNIVMPAKAGILVKLTMSPVQTNLDSRLRGNDKAKTAKENGMTDFLTAIGLAVAIEGILYALFPDAMKRMIAQLLVLPSGSVRGAGLVAAGIGVGIVWLVRQ